MLNLVAQLLTEH